MRKKYNVFHVSKINRKTIEIALKLKAEIEKTDLFNEVSCECSVNGVPLDKDKLLKHISCKYLNLKSEDGVPLLKKAFKIQYKI